MYCHFVKIFWGQPANHVPQHPACSWGWLSGQTVHATDFPNQPAAKRAPELMSSFLSLQEPVEAGQTAEPAAAAAAAAAGSKVGLEVTNEEPEPAQDIEMPPPMAIQGHSFKASPEAPAAPADDAVTKLVCPFGLDQ